MGFQVEVCPAWPLTDKNSFGAVWFESSFAWCEGDVVPSLFLSTGVFLFLFAIAVAVVDVVVSRHVDDECNQYGS